MKSLLVILLIPLFLCFTQTSHSATLCVNTTGTGGCYSSIQLAINAAATNDTVKVMPGTYNDSIVIGKKIVVMGSGHEVTKIFYDSTTDFPAVKFVTGSSGAKLMWFTVRSAYNDGIWVSAGLSPLIFNNVIYCCGRNGIYIEGAYPEIANNVIYKNNWNGIDAGPYYTITVRAYNNIITKNFVCGWTNGGAYVAYSYNCVFDNIGGNYCNGMTPGPNDIWQDPLFVDPSCYNWADFHLATGSPCKNTGRDGDPDCDGTLGDMGVYGGPHAYCGPGPVVTNLQLIPPAVVKGETFDIQASGSTR